MELLTKQLIMRLIWEYKGILIYTGIAILGLFLMLTVRNMYNPEPPAPVPTVQPY